jgi:hypothetical protein
MASPCSMYISFEREVEIVSSCCRLRNDFDSVDLIVQSTSDGINLGNSQYG